AVVYYVVVIEAGSLKLILVRRHSCSVFALKSGHGQDRYWGSCLYHSKSLGVTARIVAPGCRAGRAGAAYRYSAIGVSPGRTTPSTEVLVGGLNLGGNSQGKCDHGDASAPSKIRPNESSHPVSRPSR